jgi:hypothetical protein
VAATGVGLFTVADAHAQEFSGGIVAGASLASFVNEDYPSERRVGVRVGGFLDWAPTAAAGLRVEAAYTGKGVKTAASDLSVALDYIEIPLLARVVFPGSTAPVLFTGPAFGIKVVAERRSSAGSSDYGDLVRPLDFGWVAGVGVAIDLGDRELLIEARYTRGLRAVFDFGDPGDSDSDDKNQAISIGAGVTLF